MFFKYRLIVRLFPIGPRRRIAKPDNFTTPIVLYNWKRLPMGLTSAPGAFQYLMELLLAGRSYELALLYLDDKIFFESPFREHLSRLELMLCRMKGSKCRFFQKWILFSRPSYFKKWREN